jgi:Lar family restriction alleviation protein
MADGVFFVNEDIQPLPCPFCGSQHITTNVGSSYKWIVALCINCGAQSGEVRAILGIQYGPENRRRAIESWNERA